MSNEADNYEAINRRMREITGDKPRPAVAEEHERKPWCTAIHPGRDWPDCPCNIP